MRSLTFSIGLVTLLALSNLAYGQFSSREYLLAIGDLVNNKVLSEQYEVNPLQKLYYTKLLQPEYSWGELATLIHLKAEAEYKDVWLVAEDLTKDIAVTIGWSNAGPIKEPVTERIVIPFAEPAKKGPVADNITTLVIREHAPEAKPEKQNAPPATKALKVNSKVAPVAPETNVADVPNDFDRIKNADYIEYGDVGFYQNTAIIHPAYQAEMASLAAHMKTDLTFELLIHGHCNGNTPQTIITAGFFTKFFEIDNDHQQKIATAKEFTELRAAYAKRYLISQGISPQRIQVIGEGAEKMIYPQASIHAQYNDRVEFEIIKR